MKPKELTDLKIADFVNVTNRTLQNWKRPKEKNGVKYYTPTGKHNLYIGARLVTYLLYNNTETSNNLEELISNVNKLKELINSLEKECNSKYIKDLKEEISLIEDKIKNIEQLTILS